MLLTIQTSNCIRYRINNWNLCVDAEAPELLRAVDLLLSKFHTSGAASTDFQLRLVYTDAPLPYAVPSPLHMIWRGEVPGGNRGASYVAGARRWIELTGHGHLDLHLDDRCATIAVRRGADPTHLYYFLVQLLCSGLEMEGNCCLHAACLCIPQANRWRSVIIVAPSKTGKSTVAMALVHRGWKLMGDDLTVVKDTPSGILAWGFPRECHIRSGTLQLLPWLRKMPLAESGIPLTYNLRLEDLRGRTKFDDRGYPPALLICLEKHNTSAHRVRRIDRAEALMRVAHEAVQPIEGPQDRIAIQNFSILSHLVRRTPACALSCGPDVDSVADCLLHVLRESNGVIGTFHERSTRQFLAAGAE